MYVGFDFDKVNHAGSPYLMVRKDCPSCLSGALAG